MESSEIKLIQFQKVAAHNGIKVADREITLLASFVDLLIQKNQVINLISRKDAEFVWERHILHSILPLGEFYFLNQSKILDLGTGGGLPGIPLKILCPSIHLTMLDSINKKVVAVREFIDTLKLENTSAVCARAEQLNVSFKNKFDYIVTRAVTNLKDLISWSAPLIKISQRTPKENITSRKKIIEPGTLIVYKGGNIENEIEHAEKYKNYKTLQVVDLKINGIDLNLLENKKIVLVQF
jgi:16S rRNA (guanine527-N7)-methyltransferase